jgi:hypothetical protein
LVITSPASGGRSVGIVRSRTQNMEFFFIIYSYILINFVLIQNVWTLSTVLNYWQRNTASFPILLVPKKKKPSR